MNFDDLAAALDGRAPLADAWRPGRDRDDLAAVQVDGNSLPGPVMDWFAWHDGTDSDHELLPDGRPLPLDRALAVSRARWDTAQAVARETGLTDPVGWAEAWLPLLAAHQEELCWVVDCSVADPQVLLVDSEDPDPKQAFTSVAALVADLAAAWAAGAYDARADGRVRPAPASSTVAGGQPQLSPENARLVEALQSDDEDTAWEATEAIAARLSPDFLAGLDNATTNAPLAWTRTRAVELIAQIGGSDAEQVLTDILLTRPDAQIRETAAAFLDPYDTSATADALVGALDDPAPAVRAKAAYSLAGMVSSITAVHLEALETHRAAADPEVAKAIDYTLGALRR